jgi:Tol biopolymer transport system component
VDSTLTVWGHPAISPDGGSIAFEYETPGAGLQGRNIWIYDTGQRTFSPLTFDGNMRHSFWSPDGREVGFSSGIAAEVTLRARPADSSDAVRLLFDEPSGDPLEGRWTPDGTAVVFRANYDVRVASLASDTSSVAVPPTRNEANPMVSPDGRWLAYRSDESGANEVYVRPFGSAGGRWQVSTSGGINPIWGPDGDELFYISGNALFVATVSTAADFSVLRREQLFSTAAYLQDVNRAHWDVSPDGERFLFLLAGATAGAGSDQGRYILIDNWFTELEERLGG